MISNKTLRTLTVILISIHSYLSLFYLGSYMYITMSWSRMTLNVVIKTPILYSFHIDVSLITLISFILVLLSIKDIKGRIIFLVSIALLSMVGYVFFLITKQYTYLTLVGMSGIVGLVSIVLSKDYRKYLINGLALMLSSLSIFSILTTILYFTGLLSSDTARNLILLYWRGFWRFIEVPLIFALLAISIYWLLITLNPKLNAYQSFNNYCTCNHVSTYVISKLILIFSMLFPTILIIMLHLPTFNPDFAPISVDTFFYARELTKAKSLHDVLLGFMGTRPLYMLIIYFAYNIIKDPILLMDCIHPSIVLGLLVYATYRLSRKLCPNGAITAALLTAIGPTILTFIAGGYQANSLALSLILIALSLNEKKVSSVVLRYVLYLITALIHPWTFTMYLLLDIIWHTLRKEFKYLLASLATLLSVILALILLSTIYQLKGPENYVYGLLIKSMKVSYPPGESLRWALEIMTWGSLLNTPLYLLIPLSYTLTQPHLLLALIMPITLVFNKTIAHRLILNIPLGLIATYGILRLSKNLRIALILSIMAYTLCNAAALTPLTTPPWTNIFSINP